MSEAPAENPPPSSGCSWPAAIAVIAIAGLVALLVWYLMHRGFNAPLDVADKLRGLFGTEVKVDARSVTLESRSIMELATVQHRIVCVSKYTNTRAGSTATVIIRGIYTAKAGFSLEKGATFRLDAQGRVLDETIPPAKLLSLTTVEQIDFFDQQGLWNTLLPKDIEEAFRQNREQAEREAAHMGILEEARTRLKERLADMLPQAVGAGVAASPTPVPAFEQRKD